MELPLFEASIAATKPIHRWTHQEVVAWIGAVEGGRFAHVALPPGLDGAGLMKLSTMRLSQLFDGNLREARGENEGAAWTETLGGAGRVTREDRDVVGRALFSALRRESRRIAEAEGQRRMGAGHHASAEDEAGPSRRDGTAAESVQTLRGPQVRVHGLQCLLPWFGWEILPGTQFPGAEGFAVFRHASNGQG